MRLEGPVDLEPSLFGGQAFRWRRAGDAYLGVVEGAPMRLAPGGDGAVLVTGNEAAARRYLRLEPEDARRRERLARDPALQAALRSAPGLRLLRQDPWETTVAFVTSANNNVLRIERIMNRIAERWGEPLGDGLHAFPPPERLAGARESSLRSVGLGYRAPFVRASARLVARGDVPLLKLRGAPAATTREALLELPGVGPKVADCIALFSLDADDAFPIDRWVLRAMSGVFFEGQEASPREVAAFAARRWGADAGLAQQFLFHSVRLQAGAPGVKRWAG